ncbi:MAG TPA: hypothetical protein VH374_06320 [Polyangia bacterium]|nr:hypothetical protein [Polyangia bacterium]
MDNLTPIEISRIQFQFGDGSHHVHIYRSTEPEADGVSDCWSGIAWPRWQLLAGAQTKPLDWNLPDGLTMPLAPHQQLLVQVHWLNTGPMAIDGKIDLSFHTTDSSAGHVGVLFGVNKQVDLLPGQRKTISHFCPMPSGSRLIAMMGHYHALGRHYEVTMGAPGDDSAAVIYQGQDENTLVFHEYAPQLAVPDGAGLDFSCEYLNFRTAATMWGADTSTQEHCNMAAYYYPANDDDAFCIKDEDDIGTLTDLLPPTNGLRAGDRGQITVRAAAPIEADTAVPLVSSDPTALSVPAMAWFPAGAREATVDVQALRPIGQVSLTATLGTQTINTALSIGGLGISEFMADPAPGQRGGRWVELSSSSPFPIDLGAYRLGAGHHSYGEIAVPLTGMLPPFGCLLVSESPMDGLGGADDTMAVPFPIPDGLDDSGGIGLFASDADASAISARLDAVAYGVSNTVGLFAADGQLAGTVATTRLGSSLGRTTDGHWQANLVPTPGICETAP